jgi:hypothetical protein
MGLDMYIFAAENQKEFDELYSQDIEERDSYWNKQICYWRKHPDLHGYIVQTFAKGVDECQPIPLTSSGIENIISAVKDGNLPHTTGFFFGQSVGPDDQNTIEQLENVLKFLRENNDGIVWYEASW